MGSRKLISAAVAVLVWTTAPGYLRAQSLGDILGNTQRYIERQLDELGREFDNLTGPSRPPPRTSRSPTRRSAPEDARVPPPLPERSPRRDVTAAPSPPGRDATAPEPRGVPPAVEPPRVTPPGTDAVATAPPATEPTPPVREPPQPPLTPVAPAAPPGGLEGRVPPPLPPRKPAELPEPPVAPVHPRDVEVAGWTEKEIAAAKATCARLLADLPVVHEPIDPIREGECGTAAPVMVARVGAPESIRLSPPATMTCAMAAKLNRWVENAVQPAARIHLGSPIAKLVNVSSYVCRNRYGETDAPLSEHAKANALDIAAFETASGERIAVLDDWSAPSSEEVAETAKSESRGRPIPRGGGSRAPGADPVRVATAPGDGKAPVTDNSANTGTTGLIAPPKDEADVSPPLPPKARFLREVYDKACATFGTTLGPEANAAHKDHLHFDMAKRRSGYCR